jgi:hypothetical protein
MIPAKIGKKKLIIIYYLSSYKIIKIQKSLNAYEENRKVSKKNS